jgi:hypothetical protein
MVFRQILSTFGGSSIRVRKARFRKSQAGPASIAPFAIPAASAWVRLSSFLAFTR